LEKEFIKSLTKYWATNPVLSLSSIIREVWAPFAKSQLCLRAELLDGGLGGGTAHIQPLQDIVLVVDLPRRLRVLHVHPGLLGDPQELPLLQRTLVLNPKPISIINATLCQNDLELLAFVHQVACVDVVGAEPLQLVEKALVGRLKLECRVSVHAPESHRRLLLTVDHEFVAEKSSKLILFLAIKLFENLVIRRDIPNQVLVRDFGEYGPLELGLVVHDLLLEPVQVHPACKRSSLIHFIGTIESPLHAQSAALEHVCSVFTINFFKMREFLLRVLGHSRDSAMRNDDFFFFAVFDPLTGPGVVEIALIDLSIRLLDLLLLVILLRLISLRYLII